jgi:SNF2 family DNA or RNA helicase
MQLSETVTTTKALTLYPSQEDYLKRLGNKPYMFAGVGSGKTAMAQFRAHRTGATKVLVICPASVRDTKVWEKDLEKFGLEFDEFEVQGFSFLQKFKTIDFNKYSDYYVIIDEAHKVKNSQSLQGQGAFKLCTVARGFSLLSGTPMSKWADAVNYAKITGLIRNKTEFYRRYVVEQPSFAHKGMDIVGYRNEAELGLWWGSIALRGHSEDFVELPKKQVIDVNIPIKRTEYLRLLKERMTADGEPIDSAPKLNWALRRNVEVAPEKISWVLEKVDGLETCLIFVNTIDAIETLSAKLKAAKVKHGVWYGKKKDKFEDQTVMIVQYQSGGTGLNLQKFSTTIFLSPCYSFIDYTQAIGRTYRNGQPNKCTFYHLKAANTIDGAIYTRLEQGQDFDANLVDTNSDNYMKLMGGL